MKIAGIDLGSNTFLCLIGETSGNNFTVIEDIVETVRLGQGIDQSKHFHPDALKRADICLGRFREKLNHYHVKRVAVAATSAARDAQNREDLFSIGRKHGFDIQIIDGHREAEISFRGACFGLNPEGSYLVVDVGGGSTELVLGDHHGLKFKTSLNIGGVRLRERYVGNYPVELKDLVLLRKVIAQEVHKATFAGMTDRTEIIAVAGTPTTLAALAVGGYSEEKVNGFKLQREDIENWINIFAGMSLPEIQTMYQLGGRADIIMVGCCILAAVMDEVGRKSMTVSTKGVRYGLVLDLLRHM